MAGKKHRCLTLDEKANLIEASETHKLSAKALQELFKCGKTQVYNTLKRKDEIMQKWLEGNGSMKRKIKAKNEEINRLTWEWFILARSQNIPIHGPMVQAKAKELAEQQGNFLFKASNGWLESFKNRHKIKWKEIHEFNNVNGRSVQETYGEFNNINVTSDQETYWEYNHVNFGSVQETCGECPDVKVEIVQETCEESNDVHDESAQETCGEFNFVNVRSVQETCGESHDVKVEIVQETCEESNDVDVESVQETCEESNDVDVESVQETCGESHNGNIDSESGNLISGLDTEDTVNETIPSVHTYSEALQYVTQLQKFALTANNPELLQSFSTSKNIIEQVLVCRKIKKEKILNACW